MVQVCPQLQSKGACGDQLCKFNHDVKLCGDCDILCTSAASYRSHLAGKKHRSRVLGSSTLLRCQLCNVEVNGTIVWKQHIAGGSHQREAARQGVPAEVEPAGPDDANGRTYCMVCERHVVQRHWSTHLEGTLHRDKERLAAYKTALVEAEKDKHGVTVSKSLDFGIVSMADAQSGVSVKFDVETSVHASRVMVLDAKLSSALVRNFQSSFSVTLTNQLLTYGSPASGLIKFCDSDSGRYEDRLEVTLEDERLQQRFVIVRPLRAIIGDREDHALLKPKAPFVPRELAAREPETEVFKGVLPPSLKAIPYVVTLPWAEIPRNLAASLWTGSLSEVIGRVRRGFLPPTWDSHTYGRHFKSLLWVEEYRMERDLQTYDISNATMTTHRQYYFLSIPGLAEQRPSILVGDRILVQSHTAPRGQWYEGGVHMVRKEEVGLRFNPAFRGWSETQQYHVRFKLTRMPLRRQHQALDIPFTQDRLLLPVGAVLPIGPKICIDQRMQCYNKLIATNEYQLQAVSSIVQSKPGSVPFIVFGPPGTGKTVTIVEAIRQLLIQNPSARVLACAPSNSAADLIASRLTELGTGALFRFYAASRHKDQVPDGLMRFTSINGDRLFSVPSKDNLMQFRVVVATCVSASVFYGMGVPRGHFTHIFFDEAGQATEPEVMVGIRTMADNNTNVILSGDPKQLGPIIRSNVARALGLETSYLERLMSTSMYDDRKGHGTTVVKLVKNFRSHNSILKFPNERFYKSDLQQCGDEKTINAMIGSPQLVSKNFPVVFHAISGKDDREASSPSFFNIDEAILVKTYVERIRADRQFRTTDQDIGVIAPYHAQCLKIRTVLRAVADGVKVGSVEEFQGQERKIIIISTVRSSREFVQYDLKHTLGFVANPRRFNVAVTRAQALLVVVGDPSVLSLDPLWRSFLNYVHINGGWRGKPISWDPTVPVAEGGGYDRKLRDTGLADLNDFTRRMESLTLAGAHNDNDGDADEFANVDRPWREME